MTTYKEPLAYRMCPRTLEEFFGQKHIIGKNKMLYKMINADRLSSVILFGPPGTGKTSLARIIASTTKLPFEKLNAVTAGVSDIKKIVSDCQNPILNPKGRCVLFIDEIHRFNKSQQDALLPYVENGTVVLIGATTENPFFEVNKALISRSLVFKLEPLSNEDIILILKNALDDKERGFGNINIEIANEALELISNLSGGDARIALNTLETLVLCCEYDSSGCIKIDKNMVYEFMQIKPIRFDKTGDDHYDNISAFIKSMRGSDPDAAVYYLARALYAGEDIEFLARRIIICAAEDVGMANPQALVTAVAAAEAVKMIGMPEARIILSEAAIMVAASPKSNSAYMAINKALEDVQNKRNFEIPLHLRNAVNEDMSKMGYGKGYKYVHDYKGNYVKQQYLPDELKGQIYYYPGANGYEGKIKEWLEKLRSD